MIVVEGLEEAVVGWANIGSHRVVVYSVDRLSILIDKDLDDEAKPEEVREIVRFLEESVWDRSEDEKVPPPIFVENGNWLDVSHELGIPNEES